MTVGVGISTLEIQGGYRYGQEIGGKANLLLVQHL
jgi:hypothetical protein